MFLAFSGAMDILLMHIKHQTETKFTVSIQLRNLSGYRS